MANFNNYEDEMLKVISAAAKNVANNFLSLKNASYSKMNSVEQNDSSDNTSSLGNKKVLERVRTADSSSSFVEPAYSNDNKFDNFPGSSYESESLVDNPFTNSSGSSFVIAFICTITVILVIGIVCLRLFGIL